jgi:hypothetical protein
MVPRVLARSLMSSERGENTVNNSNRTLKQKAYQQLTVR